MKYIVQIYRYRYISYGKYIVNFENKNNNSLPKSTHELNDLEKHRQPSIQTSEKTFFKSMPIRI